MKIIAIRISGRVGLRHDIERSLDVLRIQKKHAAVIVETKPEIMGIIDKLKQFIAYGELDDETAKLLVEKRGRLPGDKPVDSKKVAEFMNEFMKGNKKMEDIGLKPFFRLSPPKGGFKKSIKQMYPKGVLGNYGKKINDLVKRMI